MINIKNWCKGVLSLYSHLPYITKSIDKLVLSSAIASSSYPMNAIRSADYVISLSQYKIDIINLRHLTEASLMALDEEDCALLTTRYIDNVSVEDAILVSGKARRSYFRALSRAMKNFEIIFYSKLCQSGIFDNPPRNSFWEDMFDKVNSFGEIYDIGLYPKNVCSMILRKLRRIAVI